MITISRSATAGNFPKSRELEGDLVLCQGVRGLQIEIDGYEMVVVLAGSGLREGVYGVFHHVSKAVSAQPES